MNKLIETWAAVHGDLWAMDLTRLTSFLPTEEATEDAHDRWMAKRLPRAAGTVAVIPVHGVLTKRGGYYTLGTDALGRVIDAAVASPQISGIVLDVDSPGGSVAGLPEFADKVYAVRGVKPIVAVANSLAASAAYWTLTAADQVVVTPSGDVGSIGVYSMHQDWSKALDEAGIKVTLIHAAKYKVEGNPFEPLGDDARAEFQRGVDESYADFIAAVSRNRGVTKAEVRERFGEGRVVSARRAVESGMADRIATLDATLTGMGATRAESVVAQRETDRLVSAFYGEPVASASGVEAMRAKRIRERATAGAC